MNDKNDKEGDSLLTNEEAYNLITNEEAYNKACKEYFLNLPKKLDNGAKIEQTKRQKDFWEKMKQKNYILPFVAATKEFNEKCKEFKNNNEAAIKNILFTAGLDVEQTNSILTDWRAAVCGTIIPLAPPDIMRLAVTRIDPIESYKADKYVFYRMIFHTYAGILQEIDRYNDIISDKTERWEFTEYLDWFGNVAQPQTFYRFVCVDFGYINLAIFTGEKDDKYKYKTKQIYNETYKAAFTIVKSSFVFVTRNALNIDNYKPLILTSIKINLKNVEAYCIHEQNVLTKEEGYLKAGDISFLSRSLCQISCTENLKYKTATAPPEVIGADIREKIAEQVQNEGRELVNTITSVLVGINSIFAAGKFLRPCFNAKGERGRSYELHTTLTEFCRDCGYIDPNGEQLKQIANAMFLLHNIQFLYNTGAAKRRKTGLPILFLFGDKTEKNNLTIYLPVQYVEKDNKLFATERQKKALISAKIGGEQRLNNILLHTTHKEETALLKQVYDYEGNYNEAQRNGTEKEFLRDWSKNKGQKLKNLQTWFDNAKQSGMIQNYTRKENAKKNAFVWTWKKEA